MTADKTTIHATTVAVDGRGVLIVGPSGSGKSSLAVQLIALGADLVADDRTHLTLQNGQIVADAPTAIAGLIEAREVGLIQLRHIGPTPLALVVDMGQVEVERLPHDHVHRVMDYTLPCLHKSENSYFPAAVLLYIKDKQRFPDAK